MILIKTSPFPKQHIQKKKFSKIQKCYSHFFISFG